MQYARSHAFMEASSGCARYAFFNKSSFRRYHNFLNKRLQPRIENQSLGEGRSAFRQYARLRTPEQQDQDDQSNKESINNNDYNNNNNERENRIPAPKLELGRFKVACFILGANLALGIAAWSLDTGNKLFLGPALRGLCLIVRAITGIETKFSSVRGRISLTKGLELSLRDFHIRKKDVRKTYDKDQKTGFDLYFDDLEIKYSAFTDWLNIREWITNGAEYKKRLLENHTHVVEKLHMHGCRGSIDLLERDPEKSTFTMVINDFEITDAYVTVFDYAEHPPSATNSTTVDESKKVDALAAAAAQPNNNNNNNNRPEDAYPIILPRLHISRFACNNFRNQKALFDLLFRSNMQGSVNGNPFKIENTRDRVQWKFSQLPIGEAIVRNYLKPPLNWITSADLDLEAHSEDSLWEDTPQTTETDGDGDGGSDDNSPATEEYDLRFSLVFSNITAKIPEQLPYRYSEMAPTMYKDNAAQFARFANDTIVDYLNSFKHKQMHLAFNLVINEETFYMNAFSRQFSQAILNRVLARMGQESKQKIKSFARDVERRGMGVVLNELVVSKLKEPPTATASSGSSKTTIDIKWLTDEDNNDDTNDDHDVDGGGTGTSSATKNK